MTSVELVVSIAIFLVTAVSVLTYYINFINSSPYASRIETYRQNVLGFTSSVLSEGNPKDWDLINITPTSPGIVSKIYRIPIIINETSGVDRVNQPVYVKIVFDPNCEKLAWNTTVRLYNQNLEEIPFRIFDQSYCDSQYLKEAKIFFVVNISKNSEKMFYLFFSNNTNIPAKTYSNFTHLVTWFTLDEGNGNTTEDYTGSGIKCQLKDANTTNDDGDTPPKWVDGVYGKALQFDGVDDYVDCGAPDTLNMKDKNFTVCVWAKAYNGTHGRAILSKGQWGIKGYYISEAYVPEDKYYFGVNNETTYKDVSLNLGQSFDWSFIVGEKTTDKLKAWVNKIKVGEKDYVMGNIDNPNVEFYIGVSNNKRFFFNGSVDEVRIYDKALTPEEINSSYAPPLSVTPLPEESVSVISYKKMNAMRNMLYEHLKNVMGAGYNFRIEIGEEK